MKRSAYDLRLPEGWSTVVLLAAVALTPAWVVEGAGWVESMPSLTWVVAGSLFLGLVFSRLRFVPSPLLLLVSLFLGFWVAVWNTTSMLTAGSVEERLVDLALRTNAWGYAARTGGINNDPLPFVFILNGAAWIMAYLSAWSTFRHHRAWWAVIPNGIALVVNLTYAPAGLVMWLLWFVVAAMLLIVRLHYFTQEQRWQREHVRYEWTVQWAVWRDTIVFAILVLVLAWSVPVASASEPVTGAWQQATRPWRDVQMEFNRLFASLTSKEQFIPTFFGNALPLRGSFVQSEALALKVQADKGYYWRAIAYDSYTGQGWVRRGETTQRFDPAAVPAQAPVYLARREVTQTVQIWAPKNDLIFAAGQPLRLDLPEVNAETFAPRLDASEMDLSALRNGVAFRRGQEYQVVSSVSVASDEELRAASPLYPDWVRRRYLPLPPTVPSRVRQLADSIANGRSTPRTPANPSRPTLVTPYDKVLALEAYLRGLGYSTQIPSPPPGRDAVDYFLFDLRQGYCDYFASALAVMARAVGVPARVVSGYQPGQPAAGQNTFVVSERNAHSWVEAYFPGYGWIEFEPTPSEPLRSRPEKPVDPGEEDLGPSTIGRPDRRSGDVPFDDFDFPATSSGGGRAAPAGVTWWWLAVILPALAGFAVWWAWATVLSGPALATRAYAQMCRLSSWMGIPPRPHQTPQEFAARLGQSVPPAAGPAQLIAEAFTGVRFGRKVLDPAALSRIQQAWRELRGAVWAHLWRRWLP